MTCLLQEFPNPYLTVRPLRQALYKRLGVEEVLEVLELYRSQVGWTELWDRGNLKFSLLMQL